ncbi:competence protein ComK [Bacillus massiliigorillae]|uniref:competence protein ComK n=1 Tax=Bacillus massiliigorillae TaxID=1243664 RepID=UPI00039E50E9|nr:competence protein ComK [Bacillus massiliigorillae]
MQEYNHYRISPNTMALVPARHPYYKSIVFDLEGTYLSIQTLDMMFTELGLHVDKSIKIVNESSYLIKEDADIYAFSTKTKGEPDCMWIFPKHVKSLREQTFPRLTFKNGERLKINCTKEQYIRWYKDFICIMKLEV